MAAELRRLTTAFLLLGTAAGCLSPVDPDAAPVREVRVTFGTAAAAADTIRVREVTRVSALAIGASGFALGNRRFTYSSSDTSVAVVDENGVVRGVGVGEARITARVEDGHEGHATVVVERTVVAYEIATGAPPVAMAFSRDYTRLYTVTSSGTADSLLTVDALGFFRLDAQPLGLRAASVAATGEALYVTHPDVDSVSVFSLATNALLRRIWVGAGPTGIAADAGRAYVAARYDRKLVIVQGTELGLGVPLRGEPHHVAASRDGRRVFVTVDDGGAWRLAIVAPQYPDTLGSVALSSAPGAIATDAAGERVWVLLPSERRVVSFVERADGRYEAAGSVAVAANAGGLSASPRGAGTLVVSGEPAMIVDGLTMTVVEEVAGAGTGVVAVRPDGVFAFVAAPAARMLRVIGL